MADWGKDKPRNRSVEEPECSPQKKTRPKKARKRLFVIEFRYVGANRFGLPFLEQARQWRRFRKYDTRKQRDQAFADLIKPHSYQHDEYRKVDP